MPHLRHAGFPGLALLLLILCLSGCGEKPAAPPAEPATRSGPSFIDRAEESGIDVVQVCGNRDKDHLLESTGSGVAIADYDNDGDLDLYFPTAQTRDDWLAGRRPRANALYRNEGDGRFTEAAEEAGVDLRAWSAGAYFVDYDNDGDKDLFVTAWGPNVLYKNNGDGTFTDVTAEAGVAGPANGWSSSAAFGDLDGDGNLDLYVANYTEYDLEHPPFGGERTLWKGLRVYRGPLGFTAQPDRLYRNNGDGTFRDVTAESGTTDAADPKYGLGVVFTDIDDDGDPDLYVANDSQANTLWLNQGNFRFEDIALMAGAATNEDAKEQAGMGTDAGDYDNDGRIDLFVTNFSHDWDTLHKNAGNGMFLDATFSAGLRDTYLDLAWGAKFVDYDNDGFLDLLVANGHIYTEVDSRPQLKTTYNQRNRLFRNLGNGRFQDVTKTAGPGFEPVLSSRGAAVADLDRDGDMDIILTNMDQAPNLLFNEGGNRRNWLQVRLRGTRSNRDAVGARLTLKEGGQTLTREVNPFGSYLSQGAYTVHFGLGSGNEPGTLVIRWPSGEEETIDRLAPNTFVTIVEGKGVVATETTRDSRP